MLPCSLLQIVCAGDERNAVEAATVKLDLHRFHIHSFLEGCTVLYIIQRSFKDTKIKPYST